MLENVLINVVIVCAVAPFILGWLFRSKMGMSWKRTISFAICYPLSFFLIVVGVLMTVDFSENFPLLIPIVISWGLSIIVWGIIVVLILKKKQNFDEKFNFLSYMFFIFPVLLGIICLTVFAVAALLSAKGYIGSELMDLSME